MFIIFDTNMWRSHLVLNSQAGAAVRFYIQQHGATVAIPEVVRLELERILTRFLGDLTESIKKQHSDFLSVFGALKEVVLPTPQQIREKVSTILSHLDVPTIELPFSLDVAKSSFLKTIDKLPPSSDKKEAFKDGVIWAHCLDLLADADVHLVTADKDFYSGRDYSNGLARNLRDEVAKTNHELFLYHDIAKLLESIRRDIRIDEAKLVDTFLSGTTLARVKDMLDRAGFVMEGSADVKVTLYATELATRLYIDFVIKYQCQNLSDQGQSDAKLEIRGDGSYDTSKQEYMDLQSREEKLTYTNVEGEQESKSVIIGTGTGTIGHRTVHHTVKAPLS